MAVDAGVVDDGLSVDGATELVGVVELVGCQVEVLSVGEYVPAVHLDGFSIPEDRSDE